MLSGSRFRGFSLPELGPPERLCFARCSGSLVERIFPSPFSISISTSVSSPSADDSSVAGGDGTELVGGVGRVLLVLDGKIWEGFA